MLIIGVGNKMRSDDGVGVWVAEEVARRTDSYPSIRILIASGEGAALIDAMQDEPQVVLIDATRGDRDPGTISYIDAQHERLPSGLFNYSSHAFGVAEAIEMARILGELPAQLRIYGVEGESFAAGEGLSAEVQHAAELIVAEILDTVTVSPMMSTTE